MSTRILICEDEKNIVAFLQAELEREGYITDIAADGEALKRVIRILLANCIKYSGDTKGIDITLADKRLQIRDEGIGIDSAYLTRIFDRFFRVDDSRAKDTGGTGVGLAIAQKILQQIFIIKHLLLH